MNIAIYKVLRYYNACIDDDYMYRVAKYIVKYYSDICFHNHPVVSDDDTFTTGELLSFVQRLGYVDIKDFEQSLLVDNQFRMELIHERLRAIRIDEIINHLIVDNKQELTDTIDQLCDIIEQKKRIVIIAGKFSNSLSFDFQTDMITLGKEVIIYPEFDKNFTFNEDDLVLFVTATGRTMKDMIHGLVPKGICQSDIVLFTQNIRYKDYQGVCADYVIHVHGKYDGIFFNYQTLMLYDLLRISYYQKYYVKQK